MLHVAVAVVACCCCCTAAIDVAAVVVAVSIVFVLLTSNADAARYIVSLNMLLFNLYSVFTSC